MLHRILASIAISGVFIFAAPVASAANPTNTNYEVRTGGSDTVCSGGFVGNGTTPPATGWAPSFTAGGTTLLTNTPYYFIVVFNNALGDGPAAAIGSSMGAVEQTATSGLVGGNRTLMITPPTNAAATATSWSVYAGTTSGGPYFLQATAAVAWVSGGGSNGSYVRSTPALATSGTNCPGIDQSQANSAFMTDSGTACTGSTTTITFVTGYTPSWADVNNVCQITAQTGTYSTGFFNITSVNIGSKTWTLGTSPGTAASAITLCMGGALASPGKAAGAMVGGNVMWIASAGTSADYALTSASSNVTGGTVSLPAGSQSNVTGVHGYHSARGDADGTRPTYTAGAQTSVTLIAMGTLCTVRNVVLDGKTGASVSGISTSGSGTYFERVKVINTTVHAFNVGNNTPSYGLLCEIYTCSGTDGYGVGMNCVGCYADNCTCTEEYNGGSYIYCVASRPGTDGFLTANYSYLINCVADHAGRYGFNLPVGTGLRSTPFVNCVATNCTTAGFFASGVAANNTLLNCAGYNTTNYNSANWDPSLIESFVSLSGDPFTNSGSQLFGLNTTAGAGAVLRAAGFPQVFPGGSGTSYLDIGAIQHRDPITPISSRTFRGN